MARRCELTGKGVMSGHLVSHANNKRKRVFRPNLQTVTLASDTLGRVLLAQGQHDRAQDDRPAGRARCLPAQGARRQPVDPRPSSQAPDREEASQSRRVTKSQTIIAPLERQRSSVADAMLAASGRGLIVKGLSRARASAVRTLLRCSCVVLCDIGLCDLGLRRQRQRPLRLWAARRSRRGSKRASSPAPAR